MNEFLIYIVIVVIGGVEVKLNTSVPSFPNLNNSSAFVLLIVINNKNNNILERFINNVFTVNLVS